jgi:hypothetical protein
MNIILDVITIFSTILTATVSLVILIIIIIFHRHIRSVPILLASYTCLALILSATMLASMSMSSLFGFVGIHFRPGTGSVDRYRTGRSGPTF